MINDYQDLWNNYMISFPLSAPRKASRDAKE